MSSPLSTIIQSVILQGLLGYLPLLNVSVKSKNPASILGKVEILSPCFCMW